MYLIKKKIESLLLKKAHQTFSLFSCIFSSSLPTTLRSARLNLLPCQSFPSQPKQIDRLGTNHFHFHHLGFSAKKKKRNYFGFDVGVISGALDKIVLSILVIN